jgi:NADPH-dependent curcumin reductase CurA
MASVAIGATEHNDAPLGLRVGEDIGACGTSGVTAYYGLTDIAPVQAGETLVVSAAAGPIDAAAHDPGVGIALSPSSRKR